MAEASVECSLMFFPGQAEQPCLYTNFSDQEIDDGAFFSPCRTWRYDLWRRWGEGHSYCAFVMLNPSTANEIDNDPTIRRCIGFAKLWGFDSLHILNIFAYRATDPTVMKKTTDPIGPENDSFITKVVSRAGMTVAAWGNHGVHMDREKQVMGLVETAGVDLMSLRVTKTGHPSHPLYLPYSLEPKTFEWRG